MQTVFQLVRALLTCSLLATGVLVVGCDSGGSPVDSGDDGGEDNANTMAPGSPSELFKTAGDGTVDLNWDAVDASDLDGYNVYRSTSSIGDISGKNPLNGSLVSGTSYTDDEVENGTTYYYVVSSIDTAGNESGRSDQVTALPINRQIAFSGDRDGNYGIYVTRSESPEPDRITDSPSDEYSPTWSPDRRHIAFSRNREDIYTIDLDGSGLKQVTGSNDVTPSSDVTPAWSPDGSRIAFSSDRDGDSGIYTIDPDGSDLRQVTRINSADRVRHVNPVWSPDGRGIAFVILQSDRKSQVFTTRLDDSDVRQVTESTLGDSHDPAWSPGGDRIAFSSDRDGDPGSEIYVIDPEGSDLRQVTDSPLGEADTGPTWSPDGSHIAFVRFRDQGSSSDIYMIRPGGSGLKRITDSNDGNTIDLAWSPSR